MPDFLNGLFISEILADNAGGGAVDVNGQGGSNKQDEFVEIQNNSGSAIDLNGYQIWSDQNGLLHSFGSGDQIASGGTATVVGTYNNPPAGFFGANGNNNSASSNGGFLEDGEGNKDDTIYLVAPDGNYIQLSYGNPPPTPGALPSGFPSGGTLQGTGEQLDTNAPNATSILRDANGDLTEGTPTPGTPGFVCFARGTRILTSDGEVAVEDLRIGDTVETLDHGPKKIGLIVNRKLDFGRDDPRLKPIEFKPGSLGPNMPVSNLCVSPQHRILLRVGNEEHLVAAKGLVHRRGVRVKEGCKAIEYFHLIFDCHEIVFSEGVATESFFPGPVALRSLESDVLKELRALFPHLSDTSSLSEIALSRPSIGPSQAKRMMPRNAEAQSISVKA